MRLNNLQLQSCNYIKSSLNTELFLDNTTGKTMSTDEDVMDFINHLNETITSLRKEINIHEDHDNTSIFKLIEFKDLESYKSLFELYTPSYFNIERTLTNEFEADLVVELNPLYRSLVDEQLSDLTNTDTDELLEWIERWDKRLWGIITDDKIEDKILHCIISYLKFLAGKIQEKKRSNNDGDDL